MQAAIKQLPLSSPHPSEFLYQEMMSYQIPPLILALSNHSSAALTAGAITRKQWLLTQFGNYFTNGNNSIQAAAITMTTSSVAIISVT